MTPALLKLSALSKPPRCTVRPSLKVRLLSPFVTVPKELPVLSCPLQAGRLLAYKGAANIQEEAARD